MRSDLKKREKRMELKYCEHCGALWVREGGGGAYCDRCQPKVDDLPMPKKKPGKAILPVRRRTLVEDYGPETDDGSARDGKGTGGVA
jgi:hypothetical protein